MLIALSGWWTVGWIVGAAVVVVVALLLLVITSTAQKIAAEAGDISAGLDGVTRKTNALRDVSRTHLLVARITNGLRRARGERASAVPVVGIGPGMRKPGPRTEQSRFWTRREN